MVANQNQYFSAIKSLPFKTPSWRGLCSTVRSILAAKFSIAQPSVNRVVGRKAILAATCYAVSALRKRTSHSSANFASRISLGLRFRAEFFNIFNRPNFGPPNNLTSPLFGHSTSTLASRRGSSGANGEFNPLHQKTGPRSIQLALKLQF
jgi:hypothetical protein